MENKENILIEENFGLYKTDIQKITNVFEKFSEIEEVILYGSRAKGNFKKYSDIDLSLVGQNLTQKLLFTVALALDQLMLPYLFDLNILKKISNEELLNHISRVGKVFYSKP